MVTARAYSEPPPLQSGDHLTSREFERRYEAMPELKKAELIEGVVFLASPVSLDQSEGQGVLGTWLGNYALRAPGVRFHTDGSVRLDQDNQFQPDVFLWRVEGGTARPGEKGYHETSTQRSTSTAASESRSTSSGASSTKRSIGSNSATANTSRGNLMQPASSKVNSSQDFD